MRFHFLIFKYYQIANTCIDQIYQQTAIKMHFRKLKSNMLPQSVQENSCLRILRKSSLDDINFIDFD